MATITETVVPTKVEVSEAPQAKSTLKVVLGTMNLGREGAPLVRVHDPAVSGAMLDTLQKHGHCEVDTARIYGFGSTEEHLAQLKWQERGIAVGTKLTAKKVGPKEYSHKKDSLKPGLSESLKALGSEKVDTFYLHTPDHNTPYAETLEAVNELHEAGYFKKFGICNYAAWEVAQICELCNANGWKKPDIYQGAYSALQRNIETELFPCLRYYGVAFYSFSPLAGGMLTDRYGRDTSEYEGGSRFDPNNARGFYRKLYWNEPTFAALDIIRPLAQKHGMTTTEAALRWTSHHSAMKGDKGDAVVIGSSSAEQLEANLSNLEKGPLPEDLVQAFEEAWSLVKVNTAPYFA
ncbi:hypothetical protein AC578_2671 [Pseudocercospora eumusae]|uniref:NADP-dependent oxidoreductase domain-containing protein n=1 Tax=Pseudocercospora eumusae TaxID=321146 RepID=A0A139H175_9PEZI|nr:hypothetical protein AC578_2671 [Pseudocercospora eumusae]